MVLKTIQLFAANEIRNTIL